MRHQAPPTPGFRALLLAAAIGLALAGCGGASHKLHGAVTFILRGPGGGPFAPASSSATPYAYGANFSAAGAIADTGTATDAFPPTSKFPACSTCSAKATLTRTLVSKHGTIVFALTVTVTAGKGDTGRWVISSGTGRYAGLRGSGHEQATGGTPPTAATMVGHITQS